MSKLLVVDDDEMVRMCVTTILKSIGYDVAEAKDGLEALLVYQDLQGEIRLVIMDIDMPRLDGITATQAIKEAYPSSRVILMSGHIGQLHAGVKADAFLSKPFRSIELLETVQKVLQDDIPLPLVLREEGDLQDQSA